VEARVQRSDDVVMSWPEVHDGLGTITVRRYFDRALPWPIELEVWEIPPGGSEGVHTHPADDADGYSEVVECYVVLQGRARFTLGTQTHDLAAGDALMAPPDVPHGVRNTGEDVLRILLLCDQPEAPVS